MRHTRVHAARIFADVAGGGGMASEMFYGFSPQLDKHQTHTISLVFKHV